MWLIKTHSRWRWLPVVFPASGLEVLFLWTSTTLFLCLKLFNCVLIGVYVPASSPSLGSKLFEGRTYSLLTSVNSMAVSMVPCTQYRPNVWEHRRAVLEQGQAVCCSQQPHKGVVSGASHKWSRGKKGHSLQLMCSKQNESQIQGLKNEQLDSKGGYFLRSVMTKGRRVIE